MIYRYVFLMSQNKYLKTLFKVRSGDDDEEIVDYSVETKNVLVTDKDIILRIEDDSPLSFHSVTKLRSVHNFLSLLIL